MKAIAETAELLLASRGEYQKTINAIVQSALNISGADRICLIIKNGKNDLIIKAGFPQYAHGVGQEITAFTGESFLKQVVNDESIVLVTNPFADPRLAYMRDMAAAYRISSILFLPLFSENDSIGVLVFDWVEGKKFSKDIIEDIKILGRLASTAINMEYKEWKDREKILRDEKFRALGEHSSQLAHIIRNSLMIIGGYSGRLLKYLSKESKYGKSNFDSKLAELLMENAEIIDNESKKLESIVNDILTFTTFKDPVLQSCNINSFLEDEIPRMVPADLKPMLKLSKRLNGVNAAFDKEMLSICMADLIRYAGESSASRILIKTKLKPKQKEIVISVINNGKQIHPHIIKDIFSPFVTSEINGGGLGLANVHSIIMRHGGKISVLSGDTTEFTITLPLLKCDV
jgi:signal transduction histidine kinase